MNDLTKRAWEAIEKNRKAMLDELRNAALEEAALACEARYADPNWHPDYRQAATNCADAIRDLKRTTP